MESNSSREPQGIPWLLLLSPLLAAVNILLVVGIWRTAQHHFQAQSLDEWGLPAVVAKVNGRPITRSELIGATQLAPSVEIENDLLKRTLRNLIESEAVSSTANRGEKAGNLDDLNNLTAHQFAGHLDFQHALRVANLAPKDLVNRFDRWQIALNRLNPPVPQPAETQLLAYYDQHRAAFTLPEVVEANQFASVFAPRFSAEDRAATEIRFKEAQEKLRQGTSFADLIESLSDDPAKKVTHGSLGWFRPARMTAPEIPHVAFQTPVGQVSAPIKTRYGFHLLQVTGHNLARELTFEEARPELVVRVTDQIRREKIREIIRQATAQAKIEIFSDRLR
ncbi:MAG TPA: peptidylprolyl isomerase [Chthoniobacterales bacterium]